MLTNSSELFKKGNIAVREAMYPQAIEYYNRAIDSFDIDIYWQNLFLANLKIDKKKARKKLYQALVNHPKSKILRGSLYELNKIAINSKEPIKLTIIIPVYNSGKYLEKCLRSVVNQSFTEFELIIVNDGSNDESSQIISRFSEKDSRIIVINNPIPSGNPGTPRNQALKIARGSYIGFVDSDDWIEPTYFESLMTKAISDMSDIVFSGGFRNHLNSGLIEERKYSNFDFSNPDSESYKFHDSFMIWDKIFNANLLKSLDILLGETKAAVDVPFVFKAYYYANIISYCDSLIGYNYRRESESSVTVAHRKNSNGKFEFDAYDAVFSWAEKEVNQHYKFLIQVKMVSSFLYTLKIMSHKNFFNFYHNAKELLVQVDNEAFKEFCKKQKKWWLYKEFEAICNGTAEFAFNFFDQKRIEKEKKDKELQQEKKFHIEGRNQGVMFFPTWIKSNPYQKLFYSAISKKFECSVAGYSREGLQKEILLKEKESFRYIHLHWLHDFIDVSSPHGADLLIEKLKFAKSIGYKTIYTAHNIISHDSENFENELTLRRKVLKLFDIIIAHGIEAKRRLVDELGVDPKKIKIVKHGHYGGFYKNEISKTDARKQLSIPKDAFVFLFFGNIRAYKGLNDLIREFKKIETPELYLLIAGRSSHPDEIKEIEENIQGHNIILKPGFVPDEEVQSYFKAADVCVLPYKRIVTSGAAMLSITFSCPIIAPKDGVLPEIITEKIGILFSDYNEMRQHMLTYSQQRNLAIDFSQHHKNYEWDLLIKEFDF